MLGLIAALLLVVPASAYAQTQPAAAPAYTTNAEMTAIFTADQGDRDAGPRIDWAAVRPRDAARRARTRALLDSGALQSGDDFYHAAFVFQHGDAADDCLLAHTLAVVAIARGRRDATWIATATLDRYLQRIGQKQVFGTQYTRAPDQPWTQEPYDRALISDRLRAALGVPDQAAQDRKRQAMDAEYKAAGK
ncbi:MAG: hypothetical protein E7773_09430 [Sphingomonas sp.]|nr:MAG: hypothetical protein E7773_09430 [Sphingomonas sp.]